MVFGPSSPVRTSFLPLPWRFSIAVRVSFSPGAPAPVAAPPESATVTPLAASVPRSP